MPKARHHRLAPQSSAQDITEDADGGIWFAYRDGRLGHIDRTGASATYRWREHFEGYPTDVVTAADHGVWVIGEHVVEHYTKRGKVEAYVLPAKLRDVVRGMTAVMSPCGIFWFRQSTDDGASTLVSWRVPAVAKKGCIDASIVQ